MVVPSALPERSHILLTGASGLIGARVLTFLLSKDYTVIATDIVPLPPHLPPLTSPSTFHVIDLLDHLSLERVLLSSSLKINGVIHLAAIPHPLNRDPREVFANNAVTNYNVLRTVLDLGVERVVQASSVNAAGLTFTAPERQRFDALPLNEESPMRPEDPYSLSKQVTELQATALQRLFPSTRIASLRIHAIREDYEDAYPSSHSNSLWGWVSFDAISRACLLGLTSEGWGGHEVFYTVASDICWEGGLEYESRLGAGERAKGMEEERVGTRELIKRYYPDAEVDEGWWKEDGRRGCFDCTKAERLLGWRHDA